MDNLIKEMREEELKLFIIFNYKTSLLDRSFSKTNLFAVKKKEFRKKILETIKELIKKVDANKLKNSDVREKIKELTNIDKKNISFGQAQKVVNLCLKQYCFLLNKKELYKELDCPLDSTTMKGYKEKGIGHNRMIDVTEDDYKKYQNFFKGENKGLGILEDCKYYNIRINKFLNSDK